MAKRLNRPGTKSKAVFIGRQKTIGETQLTLLNVTGDAHPLHGFTLCKPTLREFNLQVPRFLLREIKANELRSSNNEREMREE